MSSPPSTQEIAESQQAPEFSPGRSKLRAVYSNLVSAMEMYTQLVYSEASEGTQDLGKQDIIAALIENISQLDKEIGGLHHGC